jgi:hypothetical protein
MQQTTPELEMRDWIAGVALPAIITDICFYEQKSVGQAVKNGEVDWSDTRHSDASLYKDTADVAAYAAYLFADAMLEARENSRHSE